MIVFGGVEFFGAEKFLAAKLPRPLKHFHVEELLVLGGNIFKEREHASAGMLVAKRVEYEAFMGYESVSVSGDPIFCGSRFDAPR